MTTPRFTRNYRFIIAFILLVQTLAVCFLPHSIQASADLEERDLQPPFEASYSVELTRNTTFHAFEIDQVFPIHAPYNLLLGLIASERFTTDRMVTISLTAEAASEDASSFVAGHRYSVDYLLASLIMENSQSAAIALAEEIGGDIVALLNDRAIQVGLEKTQFYLAPEDWVAQGEITPGSDRYPVFSTLRDVNRLIRYIHRNAQLEPYLSSEQYSYFQPDERKLFNNPLATAWGLSLDRSFVQGAFASNYGPYATHIYLCQNQGMEMAILHFGRSSREDPEIFLRASLSAFIRRFDWIRENYETANLVYTGDAVGQDLQLQGRSIPLYYLETAQYTRPKGELFLAEEPELILEENLSLPIVGNTPLGTMNYTLENNQRIQVQVGSMFDVHTSNLLIDRLINHYQTQKTLFHWIYALTGLLIFMGIVRLVFFLLRRRKKRILREEQILMASQTTHNQDEDLLVKDREDKEGEISQ